jgi:prepilin-type N-terminal cleavage/methylation domain-containing protein
MVRQNKGVTLVELLMVLAIIGSVAFIAPSLIKMMTNFFILGKAKLELQTEARAAMYLITRELRQAQSVSIVIDQANGQANYSRV